MMDVFIVDNTYKKKLKTVFFMPEERTYMSKERKISALLLVTVKSPLLPYPNRSPRFKCCVLS